MAAILFRPQCANRNQCWALRYANSRAIAIMWTNCRSNGPIKVINKQERRGCNTGGPSSARMLTNRWNQKSHNVSRHHACDCPYPSSHRGELGLQTTPLHFHFPDSKVHGPIMGPTWGRQDPGGPHVGPMNLAIWFVPRWLSCKVLSHITRSIFSKIFTIDTLISPSRTRQGVSFVSSRCHHILLFWFMQPYREIPCYTGIRQPCRWQH